VLLTGVLDDSCILSELPQSRMICSRDFGLGKNTLDMTAREGGATRSEQSLFTGTFDEALQAGNADGLLALLLYSEVCRLLGSVSWHDCWLGQGGVGHSMFGTC
jgi:hypothetical protein